MSKKYEREIEEILRNMEQSAPRPTLGQRLRRRPQVRAPRPIRLPSFKFGLSEWCLITAWLAALLAGGWAYAHIDAASIASGNLGTSLFTGILAAISVICLLIVVTLPFLSQSRYTSRSSGNSNITPLRSNPLNGVRTRWNLFQLKLRYRRRRDQ